MSKCDFFDSSSLHISFPYGWPTYPPSVFQLRASILVWKLLLWSIDLPCLFETSCVHCAPEWWHYYFCVILQKAYFKYRLRSIKRKKKAGVDPISTAFDQMKVHTLIKLVSWSPKFMIRQYERYIDFFFNILFGGAESEKSTNTVEGLCKCWFYERRNQWSCCISTKSSCLPRNGGPCSSGMII